VGERHRAAGDHPGIDLYAIASGADGGILLREGAGLFRLDVQDAEATQLAIGWTEHRSGREQVTGVVQVGEVRHVGILECVLGVFVELRCVRAK